MRLYLDVNNNQLLDDPNSSSGLKKVSFVRGDTSKFEIGILDNNGELVDLGETYTIKVGIKRTKRYDSPIFLVYHDVFTFDSVSKLYVGTPSFNTEQLNDAMYVDGNWENDLEKLDSMFAIKVSSNGSDWNSNVAITSVIYNSVINGDEGVPTDTTPDYPTSGDLHDVIADAAQLQLDLDNKVDESTRDQPNGFVGLDANGEIIATIKHRTDTLDNLSVIVLGEGELAKATDTGEWFEGDGVTAGGNKLTDKPHISVATNNDKYLLTDLKVGQTVQITGEGDRVEQYLGNPDGTAPVTAIYLDDSLTYSAGLPPVQDSMEGIYIAKDVLSNGKYHYTRIGDTSSHNVIWDGLKWSIEVASAVKYESTEDVSTPDQVTTWTVVGGNGAPSNDSVTKYDTGIESNWVDIVPTFEIHIDNQNLDAGSSLEVNNVSCAYSALTNAGWVKAGRIDFEGSVSPTQAAIITSIDNLAISVLQNQNHLMCTTGNLNGFFTVPHFNKVREIEIQTQS